MKLKNRIIFTIITTILIVLISCNSVQAVNLAGLSGVSTILGLGSSSITNGGTYVTLSLNDMANARNKNLYCISYHNRNSIATTPYKVLAYIEIANGVATLWDVAGVSGRQSGFNMANKVLAEILSGNYGTTGYGSAVGAYTPTQKALYSYWPTWINEVGLSIGVDSSWLAGTEYSDGTGSSIVNQAISAVGSGANATARIYLLNEWTGAGQSWQRLMIASASSTPPEEEPQNPDYDGYIKIQGKVWLDGEAGKANNINGTYGDGSDLGLGGIKVTLCDSGGGQFDKGSYAYTEGDGSYEIIVNLDPRYHVYKLYEEPNYVRNKLMNGAFVKFEYDGLLYTTVVAHNTGTNTSKATEDYGIRSSFDSNHSKVTPGSGTPSGNNMSASTKSMIVFNSYPYKKTENENPTTLYCYGDGQPTRVEGDGAIPSTATYERTNVNGEWLEPEVIPDNPKHVTYTHWVDDPSRPIYITPELGRDPVTGEMQDGEPYFSGEYEQMICHKDLCTSGHGIGTDPITNLIIYNVNLGLFKREQPDIALTSDIDRVEVIMNNQKYTYKYKSQIGTPSYDDKNHFGTVKFQNKYVYTYRKSVNPADIGYINDPNSGAANEALKIYVTYKVTVSNQSSTLGVTVHKLVSDYDSEYTITSSGWGEGSNKNGFKESVTSKDLSIKLSPKETKSIEVTYSVSQNAIKGLISQDATLSNVFEIHTYSTQYGSNTLYAEQRTGGRTGKAYAGRDIDSQPGNAGAYIGTRNIKVGGSTRAEEVLDVNNGQDDTDIAPSFIIELAKKYKVIEGTVYEDTLASNCPENERLGDGIRNGKEIGVQNVRVEIIDKDTGKIANMYMIDRSGKSTGNKKYNAIPAVTYTDANGNFSFGEENTFGVVVNNYEVKYVYGNDDIKQDRTYVATTINGTPINARNYKSTIVTQNPIKGILQGENIANSEKWHLLDGVDNTTTAIDDLGVRRATTDVTPLVYGNFDQPFNMEAKTVPFELQVEYTIDLFADVDKDGNKINGSFNNKCSTFDFGIMERARENLIIDKKLTKLKLTLANGQIIIDGEPGKEDLDYTKVVGIGNPDKNASYKSPAYRNSRQKLITIEMDSEYIQGATLEVWYDITASNQSEIDYQYNSNPKYYYYGDSTNLPLVQTSIEQVVDYLDPEFVANVDVENEINKNWKTVTIDELFTRGYISEKTKNKLQSENYLAFITDIFAYQNLATGQSYTESLYASKLLANQDDELVFENHTEIVQINGVTARTINSVDDETRKQIIKTYKPGDYIPSAGWYTYSDKFEKIATSVSVPGKEVEGLHEQDDDMVKIVITPPTGLNGNIMIYIITTVIALAVIGTGVYIIKKRVLK